MCHKRPLEPRWDSRCHGWRFHSRPTDAARAILAQDFGTPEKHRSLSQGVFRPVEYFTSGCTQACALLQSGDLPRMIRCSGNTRHHRPEIFTSVPSEVSRHSLSPNASAIHVVAAIVRLLTGPGGVFAVALRVVMLSRGSCGEQQEQKNNQFHHIDKTPRRRCRCMAPLVMATTWPCHPHCTVVSAASPPGPVSGTGRRNEAAVRLIDRKSVV